MCARDRPKDQNEHREDGTGRDSVTKKSEREVTARELLRHDPGANYGRKQKSGAEPLRKDAPGKRRHQESSVTFDAPSIWPIARSLLLRLSWSRERSGSDVKTPMRWLSSR